MKMACPLLIVSFLLSGMISAQVNTDSLRQVANTTKDPSQKVTLLISLCEQFRLSEYDSLFVTSKELSQLGRHNNNLSWEITGDYYTSIYYNLTGKMDTALLIANRDILRMGKQKEDISLLTKLYSLAGNSLMRLNRQKDALEMFYACLQNAEKTNMKESLLKAYNNIGWAYMELGQFEKAIDNFKSSLEVIHRNNLPDRYGNIYNNLASCYGSIGKTDSVYKYAVIGTEIGKKYDDIQPQANGFSIIGTFLAKENRYKEAVDNFSKAIMLREKADDPFFIVSDLAEISDLQSKTGNTKEGIANGLKALSIAKENNIDAKYSLIYTALAHNYDQAGLYKEAATTYKELNTLKDSLYKDANPKALAEIQTKYETVKKEQKIEQQHNKIRLQNFLFIGIAVLVLLASLLVYSQYRKNKLRQEAKRKTELIVQQELATNAVLEAEEKERQRIAKDLHDGVGQMMSAAKMNLSAFESGIVFTDVEQRQSFEKIIGLVDESCKEVRTVSHTMMPNVLTRNGLATAITDFTDKLDKKTLGIHVFSEGLNERLDSNIEIVLYRVIQECVNNVIKHAHATTLDISIIKDKDGINATIEDNGRGFDVSDKQKFEGMGLRNILTRIEYLKGTVDFDSAPGRGTVVGLHVPL